MSFKDERVLFIHQAAGSMKVCENLEMLKKGDKLYVLINPNVDYVVEIKTDSVEILNLNSAQKAMYREAIAFMWLGFFIYGGAVFMIGYGVYQIIKERKEDRKK